MFFMASKNGLGYDVQWRTREYCLALYYAGFLETVLPPSHAARVEAERKLKSASIALDRILAIPVLPVELRQIAHREDLSQRERALIVNYPVSRNDVLIADEEMDVPTERGAHTYTCNLPARRRPTLSEYDNRRLGTPTDRYYFGIYAGKYE